MSALDDIALKRTHAVYTLTIEVRRPHSGAYGVLTAVGRGVAGEEVLVAMEMANTPLSLDVLAEFQCAVMSHLEETVARMIHVQPLLGL